MGILDRMAGIGYAFESVRGGRLVFATPAGERVAFKDWEAVKAFADGGKVER